MPVTFSKASIDYVGLLNTVVQKYHGHLKECEVRICLMMAQAARNEHGEVIAPALKLHGVECYAIASVIPYKQRAAGAADVRIDVDADKWENMTADERIALLDHELTHFELQYDGEGNLKSDDSGRPKVKIRPHDFDVGWFHSIAAKHGDASLEVQQAKLFADENGQLYWGWSSPPDRDIETAKLGKNPDA
nr:putative metallopeptidase [uncultured Rhodopila sp.]